MCVNCHHGDLSVMWVSGMSPRSGHSGRILLEARRPRYSGSCEKKNFFVALYRALLLWLYLSVGVGSFWLSHTLHSGIFSLLDEALNPALNPKCYVFQPCNKGFAWPVEVGKGRTSNSSHAD
jgi:hypothetical protein